MPAQRCSNGKWKWGQRGSCVFDTEEEAERAGRAIERSTMRLQETYKPTDGMVTEAKRGLAWVDEYGRGGTNIGRGRATDIVNRRGMSLDTVKRMKAYFDRHEIDKQGKGWSPGEDGYPSNGRIAWALWGGDPGWSWAKNIVKRSESLDNG
jgi:hypothetical protein